MLRYVLFLAFFSYWAYTLFRRFMYSTKKGGIIIWYVVYCPHQNMQNLMELCKKTLSEQAAACVFTFTYDRMKRYQGEWHLERSLSFPDYFFIESSNGEQLEKEMNRNELASKILATGGIVTPVDTQEEELLRRLSDDSHHMGMSTGYIAKGKTYVTQGPLVGYESRIRKIDRHKRLARLSLPYAKGEMELCMGLEITSKS